MSQCVCVCVTLLHIPTMRRHGVARVHPSVSVFPSVSLRRAISALLPDPLDTVRAFPDLSAGCLSVCLSVSSLHSRIVSGTTMLP
jgi:hypothetical protein